jgi:hypothetical protein
MGLRRKGEWVKREINNLLLAPAGKGKGKIYKACSKKLIEFIKFSLP